MVFSQDIPSKNTKESQTPDITDECKTKKKTPSEYQ
jgi:hypothetical protein